MAKKPEQNVEQDTRLELEEFTLRAPSIPVHEEGSYPSLWTGLSLNSRVKFGVKNRESKNPSDLEPCVKFVFSAVKPDQPGLMTATKLWQDGDVEDALNQIDWATYTDDYGDVKPIRFSVTTGLTFVEGSTRSNLTKYMQGVIGRKLQSKEIARLPMRRLFLLDLHPVNVTIVINDTEEGPRNSIVSVRRPETYMGKKIGPIPIETLLLNEVPKTAGNETFDQD